MIDLEIYSNANVRLYIVDTYESLIWTERYSEAGDFELVVPASKEALDTFELDRWIKIKDSNYVMVIESIEMSTDAEEGNKLKISGRSLESIIDRRIIWNQTILESKLQTAIKKLLDENVIDPIDTNRAISNFVFNEQENDYLDSLTIKAQYTGKNLYDVICEICKSYKLGYRIRLNDNGEMVFSLFYGTDRTYAQNENPYVIFSSKFDNVNSSRFIRSSVVKKNVDLVAGEGEGSERKKIEVSLDGGTWTGLDRREMFSDRRDVSSNEGAISDADYYAQLTEAGTAALAEQNKKEAFEADVDSQAMFVYGVDYFMGDILQFENEYGIKRTIRVTELIRSVETSGYKVYPTFNVIEE